MMRCGQFLDFSGLYGVTCGVNPDSCQYCWCSVFIVDVTAKPLVQAFYTMHPSYKCSYLLTYLLT